MTEKTSLITGDALLQAITSSPSWGRGGSFVLDQTSGERITEEEWMKRQAAASVAAPTAAPSPTTKTSKGASNGQ